MAKIDLDNVASGYNRQRINNNFQEIETELNTKVLYRDNPAGEPNQMENDLDMNSNDITNTKDIYTDRIRIGGKWVTGPEEASARDADTVTYDNTASGLTATNVQDAIDEVDATLDTRGTAFTANVGTAPTEVPKNADLPTFGTATSADVGTDPTEVPTNGDLYVDSIADLPAATGSGRKIYVKGYYDNGQYVGGGQFVDTPSKRHDGGSSIDPLRVAEIGTDAYYVDSGIDVSCWERLDEPYSSFENYGVDSSTSYAAAANSNNKYQHHGDYEFIPVNGGAEVTVAKKEVFSGSLTAEASASYGVGSAGDINTFSMLNVKAENITLRNLEFDGNGQATLTAYNPTAVNVWMIPFVAGGSAHRTKFRDLNITDNGGHAVETANVNMVTASGITADNHNGIGSTNGYGHNYYGISSYQTHDSHFFLNSVSDTGLFSFIAKETTNGGGFDLAGGNNIAVVGGVSTDSKKSAGWLLKSPNTGALLNRALVSGIVSHNNSIDSSTGGSFLLGDYNNPTQAQGADWMLTSSLINITDTLAGGGSHFNSAVSTVVGCERITFTNNHIAGVIAPSDANIYVDNGSTDSIYAFNSAQFGGSYAHMTYTARPQGRGSVWRGNIGSRVKSNSVYKPTVMVDDDGYWRYSIIHKPASTAQFTLAELAYLGGFTRYLCELTVTQSGNSGQQQRRIVLKGFTGGATTVHENTTIYTYDTPPTVVIDTALNAKTLLKITPTNTEEMQITLRVMGPTAGYDFINMFP